METDNAKTEDVQPTVQLLDPDGIARYLVTLEDGYKQVFYLPATDDRLIARCRMMKQLGVKSKLSDW